MVKCGTMSGESRTPSSPAYEAEGVAPQTIAKPVPMASARVDAQRLTTTLFPQPVWKSR